MEKLRKIYEDIQAKGFKKEAGTIIVIVPENEEIHCIGSTGAVNQERLIASMVALVKYACNVVKSKGKNTAKKRFITAIAEDIMDLTNTIV